MNVLVLDKSTGCENTRERYVFLYDDHRAEDVKRVIRSYALDWQHEMTEAEADGLIAGVDRLENGENTRQW